MEGSGFDNRYCRGGVYDYTGSSFPAHYRGSVYPSGSSIGIRFEGSTLYQVALNPAGVAPEHNKTIKNKYKY